MNHVSCCIACLSRAITLKAGILYYLCMVLVFGHDLKNEVFHD